jgi:cell division protein FtsB
MFTLLRQLGYLAAIAVGCFYVFIVLKGPTGIPAMLERRQQIERMKEENEELKQEIRRRDASIRHLEQSGEAKERAVREHTHKSKDNETIIYLPEGQQDPDKK